MLDAEHPKSLCHDIYAKRFMDAAGMRIFAPFRSEKMPNISNTARCFIIDNAIRNQIAQQENSLIITIGAGFDSRPYRINGGEWVEVDEPQIIEYKNKKLPIAECTNNLTRISIDFSHETLLKKLALYREHQHVIIVIEGVFMYLENPAIEATIKQLQMLFPKHILLCDLMTKKMFDQFAQSVHNKLMAAGARFTARPENPAAMFTQHGYIECMRTPMFKQAIELGILWDRAKIPAPIAKLLTKTVLKNINGYAVHQFVFG